MKCGRGADSDAPAGARPNRLAATSRGSWCRASWLGGLASPSLAGASRPEQAWPASEARLRLRSVAVEFNNGSQQAARAISGLSRPLQVIPCALEGMGGGKMTAYGSTERITLERGVEKLRDLLSARGFEYSSGDEAVSSGGAFAVGVFRRGALEIGLIVRHGIELGCPNYSVGRGYAGHSSLVWALGAEGKEQLVAGKVVSFQAREGGDAFEALRHDLESIVLPALDASEALFLEALARAVNKR